jgi:DNA invertase Pin-like site-specific DNA recombinase
MTDAMDLTTPQGRMMFGIISVMAEFERGLIQERVKAGMRAAKAKGHLPGRKCQKLDLDAIRSRIAAGESLRSVAGTLNVSPALLSKRLKGLVIASNVSKDAETGRKSHHCPSCNANPQRSKESN